MTATVTVDVSGAQMGGAARFAGELRGYLARTGRRDVRVIGSGRRVGPRWLLQRELSAPGGARRGDRWVAVNNVSFVAPGAKRWALLHNALHFLTAAEAAGLDPGLRASVRREAAVVRLCARRADVIVVPCTAMADRVARVMPGVRPRLAVRPHPVSADPVSAHRVSARERDPAILCPVLFAPYKQMSERLAELMIAVSQCGQPSTQVRVTAAAADVPPELAADPRLEFLGRLDQRELSRVRARSRVIYFPTGLESFGYPLAEARASGHPVIARDTPQHREIAAAALCGFRQGDPESLRAAVALALTKTVAPDPAPFDPDAYFNWMLGEPR